MGANEDKPRRPPMVKITYEGEEGPGSHGIGHLSISDEVTEKIQATVQKVSADVKEVAIQAIQALKEHASSRRAAEEELREEWEDERRELKAALKRAQKVEDSAAEEIRRLTKEVDQIKRSMG